MPLLFIPEMRDKILNGGPCPKCTSGPIRVWPCSFCASTGWVYKTETRRLWDKPRVKEGSIQGAYCGGQPFSECPDCFGSGALHGLNSALEVIPVCPVCHGKGRLQPFAKLHILKVWREPLGNMEDNPESNWREGFVDWYDFMQTFIELYRRKCEKWLGMKVARCSDLMCMPVWVVRFERGK